MSRVPDDLCSMGSVISSAFTELEDDGNEEDQDQEPPEMKYTPVEVKTEAPDSPGNVSERDIDDDFIRRCINDNEPDYGEKEDESMVTEIGRVNRRTRKPRVSREIPEEERDWTPNSRKPKRKVVSIQRKVTTKKTGPKKTPKPPKAVATSEELIDGEIQRKRKRRKSEKVKEELTELEADDDDDETEFDWEKIDESDDDWAPQSSAKKKKSMPKKPSIARIRKSRGSSRGDVRVKRERMRMTPEERREKDKERKREWRKQERVRREEIKQLEDDGFLPKNEWDESDLTPDLINELYIEENGVRRKKQVSEMTPEQVELMRERWRVKRETKTERLQGPGENPLMKDEAAELKHEFGEGTWITENGVRRKKRISEMTPEQAERIREQWRQQHKRQRAKERHLREVLKSESNDDISMDGSISIDGDEMDMKPRLGNTRIGGRKKRIAEMTPEEVAAIRARWAAQRERKKARKLLKTPQQLEEDRRKAVERTRLRRALAKEGALSDEQMAKVEEQYRKDRERKRARRAAMTPQEKREEMQRNMMYRVARYAKMSEDEKREQRQRAYMMKIAKEANMSTDQVELQRLKKRERGRKRYAKLKETLGLEGIREMRRNYWQQMTPERKSKALAKLRECYKRRVDKLKEDPEKWEEIKKQWYERDKAYKAKRRALGGISRRRGTSGTKTKTPGGRKKTMEELTEDEKERRRLNRRKAMLRRKLRIQKLLDSGMTMEEIHQQTENPEQRERRLIRQRINKAKINLRKNLQSVGAPPDEIIRRVEELKQTYQPVHSFRPYKPRPDNWKRVDETLVSELLDEKPGIDLEASMASPPLDDPTPSTSKVIEVTVETCTPRKRGRPFKSAPQEPPPTPVQATTSVIISREAIGVPSQPIQIQLHQPQTLTPVQATVYPHQQAYSQSHYTTTATVYPHSTTQVIFQYPHQQPQALPHQQSFALQHILDGITYQESSVAAPTEIAVVPGQVVYHHYDTSTTSSQHEYGSSYYDDDNHSTPVSPGGDAYEEYSTSYVEIPSEPQPAASPQPVPTNEFAAARRGRGKASGSKKQRAPRKYYYRPPKNPEAKLRTKKADVIRDSVCDQCGQAFNRMSLRAHRNQQHNPLYSLEDRNCKLCGEHFKHAQTWYSHYLNVHVKPNQPPNPRATFICDICGKAFSQKTNMDQHKFNMHGDGTKHEFKLKCPVCVEEKRFKGKMSLYSHLKRAHPDYHRGGHDCARCEETFPNVPTLKSHVLARHPESYFPCPYCTCVRFTQMGLNFHHSRCTKITKEQKAEREKQFQGVYFMEKLPITCELCNAEVILSSLTRHYRDMHCLVEDRFLCPFCKTKKTFRNRGFWMIHMEEMHLKPIEELKELVRKVNASNKEGMSVQPIRSRGFCSSKRSRRFKRSADGKEPKKKAKRKKPADSEEEDEEEEEWGSDTSSDLEYELPKRKRLTRNVHKSYILTKKRGKFSVIAEEDDEENQGDEENMEEAS